MTLEQILEKYELYRKERSTSNPETPHLSEEERRFIIETHTKITGDKSC